MCVKLIQYPNSLISYISQKRTGLLASLKIVHALNVHYLGTGSHILPWRRCPCTWVPTATSGLVTKSLVAAGGPRGQFCTVLVMLLAAPSAYICSSDEPIHPDSQVAESVSSELHCRDGRQGPRRPIAEQSHCVHDRFSGHLEGFC